MDKNDTRWSVTLISDLTWSHVERVTNRIANASRTARCAVTWPRRDPLCFPRAQKISLESVLLTVSSE